MGFPRRARPPRRASGRSLAEGLPLMNKMVLITTASLLTSCAQPNWTKTGATAASLETDKAQCHYEAEIATAAVENAVAAGVKEAFIETACLRARGWNN